MPTVGAATLCGDREESPTCPERSALAKADQGIQPSLNELWQILSAPAGKRAKLNSSPLPVHFEP